MFHFFKSFVIFFKDMFSFLKYIFTFYDIQDIGYKCKVIFELYQVIFNLE